MKNEAETRWNRRVLSVDDLTHAICDGEAEIERRDENARSNEDRGARGGKQVPAKKPRRDVQDREPSEGKSGAGGRGRRPAFDSRAVRSDRAGA